MTPIRIIHLIPGDARGPLPEEWRFVHPNLPPFCEKSRADAEARLAKVRQGNWRLAQAQVEWDETHWSVSDRGRKWMTDVYGSKT